MPSPSLLQRLEERKLVQWALAYLVFAAGILGALDAISEPFSVFVGAQQVIIVFLVFGFLLTLLLAWYHGKPGRQGIRKEEVLLLTVLILTAVIGTLTARGISNDSESVGPSNEALAKFN